MYLVGFSMFVYSTAVFIAYAVVLYLSIRVYDDI